MKNSSYLCQVRHGYTANCLAYHASCNQWRTKNRLTGCSWSGKNRFGWWLPHHALGRLNRYCHPRGGSS